MLKNFNEFKESLNEGRDLEINNDQEFKDWLMKVLKNAHGDNFDEEKAKAMYNDLIKQKEDGDDPYGKLIGKVTNGLDEMKKDKKD